MQEWQKAAVPLTIKPSAEALIVTLKRGNHSPPQAPPPPRGPEDEEGGGRGQQEMCGWTKWHYGWLGVGRVWQRRLRAWAAS